MPALQVLHPDDWQLWRHLRLEALADAPSTFGATLADWSGEADSEPRWRARLTTVPFNAILHWREIPAGMVGAYLPDPERAELISLWVTPSARGHGVGDAAVNAVLRWAGNREVGLSVKSDNQPAIRLYQRHGFVLCATPDETGEHRMLRPRS